MPNPYTFVNWGILGEGKEPVPAQQGGWVVKFESKIQDDANWNQYEFYSDESYYLNVENAIRHFIGRLREYEEIRSEIVDSALFEGWVSLNLGMQPDAFEMPTLLHLFEKGYLDNTIPNCNSGDSIIDGECFDEYLLNLMNDMEFYELFIEGCSNMLAKEMKDWNNGFWSWEIEKEFPQNTYSGHITKWDGPKWEDKDKGDE